MKKNFLIVFLVFLFGTIITFLTLLPSYNIDGYCNLKIGFIDYSTIFLASGRFVSTIFYCLFGLLHFSFEIVSIFSILLSNLFLSLSVFVIYHFINKDKNYKLFFKALILVGSLLIFYNPFILEFLLFEESFSMCFGILLVSLAACYINKNSKKNLLISLFLLFVATGCYQGVLCLFIPLAIVLYYSCNFDFKDVFKFLLKCIVVYAVAYILSYLFVLLVNFLLNTQSEKVGSIDFKTNFLFLYKNVKNLLITFSDYIDYKIFYIVFFVILISILLLTIKNFKYYYKTYIYIILLLIGNIVVCVGPYILMDSNNVYICARMCIGLTAIIGMLLLLVVKMEINSNVFYYIMIFISICFLLIVGINYYSISYDGYSRFVKDKQYAIGVQNRISQYEKENNIKIKNIYFHRDINPTYKYDLNDTAYTVTILSNNWGFECGINGINKKQYIIKNMSEEDYLKYFDGLNFDELNVKQFVFKKDSLYLLLY